MRTSSRLGFGLVLALSSLVGFSSNSSAQSQAIAFSDEVEACVTLPNGSMWLSTLELKPALEAATGLTAVVGHASQFALQAPNAGGGRFFRCENCQPLSGSAFLSTLQSKGYVVETDGMAGALPGASDGWVRFASN